MEIKFHTSNRGDGSAVAKVNGIVTFADKKGPQPKPNEIWEGDVRPTQTARGTTINIATLRKRIYPYSIRYKQVKIIASFFRRFNLEIALDEDTLPGSIPRELYCSPVECPPALADTFVDGVYECICTIQQIQSDPQSPPIDVREKISLVCLIETHSAKKERVERNQFGSLLRKEYEDLWNEIANEYGVNAEQMHVASSQAMNWQQRPDASLSRDEAIKRMRLLASLVANDPDAFPLPVREKYDPNYQPDISDDIGYYHDFG